MGGEGGETAGVDIFQDVWPRMERDMVITSEGTRIDSLFLFFFLVLFFFLRAAPVAYGGFQARGRMGATAASLHHSHSDSGSEPHLRPTPQLVATPTEQGQGSNLCPHGC